MARACLNCGQTRAQAESANMAQQPPNPNRWHSVTRLLSSRP